MKLTSKHIIFIAVSNYINAEEADKIKTEIAKYKRLSDLKFIRIIEKYFNFNMLRDKPVIPEDIWLFNYLMYDNKKPEEQKLYEIGEKINFKGRLIKKGLIVKYENRVILPQLETLRSANKILKELS